MWFLLALSLPLSVFGVQSQVPLHKTDAAPSQYYFTKPLSGPRTFNLKEGRDVFSPTNLVELPRPGVGVPNPSGDLLLIHITTYSVEERRNRKAAVIASIDIAADPLKLPLVDDAEAFWLDSRTIAYAAKEPSGNSLAKGLYAVPFSLNSNTGAIQTSLESPIWIGYFPTATATNFCFTSRSDYLVFSDEVYEDGDIMKVTENDEAWEARANSAYVFDATYARHWDTWMGPKTNALFSVKLTQNKARKWILGDKYINLLNGTGHSSPVEPYGGVDHFDVSPTHVIYTTRDPDLPPALHTKQDVYIVDLQGENRKQLTTGKHATTENPIFNYRGDKVAWIELKEDGHEVDRARIVLYDLKTDVRHTLTQGWDRSAKEIAFSRDGKTMYLTAEDYARVKIFVIPIPEMRTTSTTHSYTSGIPAVLTQSGSAYGIHALTNDRLLFTHSSFISPNDVFVLRNLGNIDFTSPYSDGDLTIDQLTTFTDQAFSDKSLAPGEEFWFEGAERKLVHGWIFTPPGFVKGEEKKWPAILLIHGGPEGVWADTWSNRWNPTIFAHQGYVVVAINPTGSTSFGQDFVNAIKTDWAGKPIIDLQRGWKHVLDEFPEIDTNRTVAAGASYGGYALNWIQGHPELGFNFKALACHDGLFDVSFSAYATDQSFFFNYEFGGYPWEEKTKEILKRNNPMEFVDKWETPELVIHNGRDYRAVEAEGMAVFNALQQRKISSRLVVFPDENHWVLKHANSLKWHYEIFRWFDEFVGKRDV